MQPGGIFMNDIMQNNVGKGTKIDRLCLFSFLWAVANVFHFYSSASTNVVLNEPFSWLVIVFVLPVLLYPRSILFLLLMLFFSMAKAIHRMPYINNHLTFEFFLNIAIVSSIIFLSVQQKRSNTRTSYWNDLEYREKLFDTFTPVIRVSILVLYFYAVLHKLNWDYFNAQISCSTILLEGMGDRYAFVKPLVQSQWLRNVGVWGSLIIEAVIPALLIFKRTRWAGIFLGLGFHYFLSFNPEPGLISFSAMLFAIFFLFTEKNFTATVTQWVGSFLERRGAVYVARITLVAMFISLAILLLLKKIFLLKAIFLGWWTIWGTLVLIVFVLYKNRNKNAEYGHQSMFNIKPGLLWLIPAILVINGMIPYFGFKTEMSFSMFSNLRTEGGVTNHLFIPTTVQLTNLQKDLVDITETNLDINYVQNQYIKYDRLITFFELRRLVYQNNKIDFYIKYIRNGQLQEVRVQDGKSNKPEMLEPYSWFVKKFIRFRPVDKRALFVQTLIQS